MGKRVSQVIELFAAVLAALLVVNVVVYLAVFGRTKEKVVNDAVEEARTFACVLEPRVVHEMESHTVQYVYQTLGSVDHSGRAKTFSLYGKKGNLIFSSEPVAKKDISALKGVSSALLSGQDAVSFSKDGSSLELIHPLKNKEHGTYGALSVGIKGLRPSAAAYEKTLGAMVFASVIVIFIAGLVMLIIKYVMRDVSKRVSAEIYRLEVNEEAGHETDYRGLGYFSYVLFRVSNYIKDLKEEVKKRDRELADLKCVAAKQEEFLKLTYKNFIPKSFKSDRLELEVKHMPYAGGFRDFAFIHHFDHLVYIVMGNISVDGIEAVLDINAIEGIVKKFSLERRTPREINAELVKRVKDGGSAAEINSLCAVLDLKTNRMRHFGNIALPIILWKKSDVSFMLLKPQGEYADFSKNELVGAVDSTVSLADGDKIIVFNQNLIDIQDGSGKRLGLERFMDMLSKNIESLPANLGDIIAKDINGYCEGNGKGDVVFIIAQWHGLIEQTEDVPGERFEVKRF